MKIPDRSIRKYNPLAYTLSISSPYNVGLIRIERTSFEREKDIDMYGNRKNHLTLRATTCVFKEKENHQLNHKFVSYYEKRLLNNDLILTSNYVQLLQICTILNC